MRRLYLDGRDGQLSGASCDNKPRLWDSETIDSGDDLEEQDSDVLGISN
jgi:hypothetical protein